MMPEMRRQGSRAVRGAVGMLTLGLLLAAWAAAAPGQGLALSPTRVILTGRERTAEVLLINRGQTRETYRITLVNKRMNEEGGLEPAETPRPGEHFADRLIRYAPRQVTLPPGATQTVRLLVRRPPDMQPGEYRSHLTFRSVPPPDAGQDVSELDLQPGELAVQMIRIYEVSIPVIVRQGELAVAARISDLALHRPPSGEGPPVLSFRLHREGERTLYGMLRVALRGGGSEEPQPLTPRQLVALYTPNRTRTVRVNLTEDVALDSGTVEVTLHDLPEAGGELLAQARLAPP